ncbi:MAG: amidohydrolase, partial [Flavobacteriales bacterium]|nr:amidohydrolase [Flavobacteriales bacterium]
MKNLSFIYLLFIFSINLNFSQSKTSDINQDIFNSIERHSSNLISISDEIWKLAETAFNEHKSSKILADYATKNGFSVEMGVADMPTAFVAT